MIRLSGKEQSTALDAVRRRALDEDVTPDRAQEDDALCEAQLKKVVEWDKGMCPHPRHRDDLPLNGRKDCHKCWQSLLEEGKE